MAQTTNVEPVVTKGLIVTIEVKPGREADIETMLRSGLAEVQKEPDTIAWLAIRLGPTTFAVVDVFPDDAGRQFHLDAGRDRLAGDTLADLLAAPPSFTYTDVVAAKLPGGSAGPALERNKETVLAFYQSAINDKDFEAASAFLGDHYVQHNPAIADGAEGLKDRIEVIREKSPELRAEVKKIVAEGDLVIAHVHGVRAPGQRGTAVVDIFRLDGNGKLVEHWDVMQDVPDHAENPNGMF
jgi:predicted SnoaL-like aldol condensation-catalyzing enzyme/quinol monooxygenase YgiN